MAAPVLSFHSLPDEVIVLILCAGLSLRDVVSASHTSQRLRHCTMLKIVWECAWPYSEIPLPNSEILNIVLPAEDVESYSFADAKSDQLDIGLPIVRGLTEWNYRKKSSLSSLVLSNDLRDRYWHAIRTKSLMCRSLPHVQPVATLLHDWKVDGVFSTTFSFDGEIFAVWTKELIQCFDFSCGQHYSLPMSKKHRQWELGVERCVFEGQQGYIFTGNFTSESQLDVLFVPCTPHKDETLQPARCIYSVKGKLGRTYENHSLLNGRFLVRKDSGFGLSCFTSIVDLSTGNTYSFMTEGFHDHFRIWEQHLVTVENGRIYVYPLSRLRDGPGAVPSVRGTPSNNISVGNSELFCTAVSYSPILDNVTREHAFSAWLDHRRSRWGSDPDGHFYASQLYAIPQDIESISPIPTELCALHKDLPPLSETMVAYLPPLGSTSVHKTSIQSQRPSESGQGLPSGIVDTRDNLNTLPQIASTFIIRARYMDAHHALTRMNIVNDPSKPDYFVLSRRMRGAYPRLVHEPLMVRSAKEDSAKSSTLSTSPISSSVTDSKLWKFDAGHLISSMWNEVSGRICIFKPQANPSPDLQRTMYSITLYEFCE
ncbi:hypothetical protein DL93DRAFT_771256 [Clavulina sp. PMI_390]|nr:hypothetical protein DL93DRAFT_771256 [Clavulina sp. PMI_390]